MFTRKTKAVVGRAHAAQPLPPLQFSHPLPYGALLRDRSAGQQQGVQFVVYSRSATAMRVLLYDGVDDAEPAEVITLDPGKDRWGDIWSIFVPGVRHGQLVDHGVGQAAAEVPVALPVEGVVDHHALRGADDRVVTRQEAAGEGPRVGVDEPGLTVEPLAAVGIERPVGLEVVELPVPHTRHEDAPDVAPAVLARVERDHLRRLGVVRYLRELVRFRLDNPTLRRRSFLEGGASEAGGLPDVEWFSPEGSHVDWYAADSSLVCFFGARRGKNCSRKTTWPPAAWRAGR
ncbi:MAG: hypothetical protein ACKOHK_11635, partial [Planctomycetia bacterium]